MCQLTMIDIKDGEKLDKVVVRPLTEMNTLGINATRNHDGFGYMLFENPGKTRKSKEAANIFWANHWEEFDEHANNASGIYHVRAASGAGKNRAVKDKNAHPFTHGHITLAHNGTLELKHPHYLSDEQKDIEGEFDISWIDSERFCYTVSEIAGPDLLTAEHIKQAYSMFTGKFAFLIFDDRQPDKVFVVRGKSRELNALTIYSGKGDTLEQIGMIINTGDWELAYFGRLVKYIINSMTDKTNNVKVGIKELEEESIFEYKIGSYDISNKVGEIEETEAKDFKAPITKSNHHHNRGLNNSRYANAGYWDNQDNDDEVNEDEYYKRVVDIAMDLNLSLKEVWILSEVMLEKNIQTYTIGEMKEFMTFMEQARKDTFKIRVNEWSRQMARVSAGRMTIYKDTQIPFPYLLCRTPEMEEGFDNFIKENPKLAKEE